MDPVTLNYIYLALAAVGGYVIKHAGVKMPILHQILVAIFPGSDTPAPADPAVPAVPTPVLPGPVAPASSHPLLDMAMRALMNIFLHPTMTPAEKTAAAASVTQLAASVPPPAAPAK